MKHYLSLLLLLPCLSVNAASLHSYACDDGSSLQIRFATTVNHDSEAILNLPGGEFSLPQIRAASGAHYQRGPISLWIKGQEALVETANSTRRCKTKQLLSSFIDIQGSVTYLARIALPPDAILTIKIEDAARTDVRAKVLAEQRYELAGAQVPIPFSATIDRDLAGPRARLVVSARIDAGGKGRFMARQPYRPLPGHEAGIDLILKPFNSPR